MQEHKPPTKNSSDSIQLDSEDKIAKQVQKSYTNEVSNKNEKESSFYHLVNNRKENFLRSLEVGKGIQLSASANLHKPEDSLCTQFQSHRNTNHIFSETPDSLTSVANTKSVYSNQDALDLYEDNKISHDRNTSKPADINDMYKRDETLSFYSRDLYGIKTSINFEKNTRSMACDLNTHKNSRKLLDSYAENSQSYFSYSFDNCQNTCDNNQIVGNFNTNYKNGCNYQHPSNLVLPPSLQNDAYPGALYDRNFGENMMLDKKGMTMSKIYNFNIKMLNKNHGPYSASESFMGCVHSEKECRILIDYAMNGYIGMIRRRINEKEKCSIRPGSIFIFNESESGIKRWTDKKQWSPSRLQGPFLVYKELNGPLYKKTYTLSFADSVYHLISYSYLQWEENGECCKIFKKTTDKNNVDQFKIKNDCYHQKNSAFQYKNQYKNASSGDSYLRDQEDSIIDEYKQLVGEASKKQVKDEYPHRNSVQNENSCTNEGMDTLDAYFNVNS